MIKVENVTKRYGDKLAVNKSALRSGRRDRRLQGGMAPENHHDEHHHRVHLVDGGHGVGGRVRHPQGSDGGQEAHRIPARKPPIYSG